MFSWPPLRMLKDTLAVCLILSWQLRYRELLRRGSRGRGENVGSSTLQLRTESGGPDKSQGVTTWFGLWVNLRVTKITFSWNDIKSPKNIEKQKKASNFSGFRFLFFFEKKPHSSDLKMEIGIYIFPECSRTVENTGLKGSPTKTCDNPSGDSCWVAG